MGQIDGSLWILGFAQGSYQESQQKRTLPTGHWLFLAVCRGGGKSPKKAWQNAAEKRGFEGSSIIFNFSVCHFPDIFVWGGLLVSLARNVVSKECFKIFRYVLWKQCRIWASKNISDPKQLKIEKLDKASLETLIG